MCAQPSRSTHWFAFECTKGTREVNPIVKPMDAWDDPNDHFFLRLRAEPLVEIALAPSGGSPDMAGPGALTRDGQAGDEWFSLFKIS